MPSDKLPDEVSRLCERLRDSATEVDQNLRWPQEQMRWCAEAGVFRWFIPEEYSGWGWSEQQILSGYLALSQSCLTTTFILTQWNAACRRLVGSSQEALRRELLPKLADGEKFATVGISHLSTSRQHLGRPVLTASRQADGSFLLNGLSPWVTAATAADIIVLGATLEDATEIMCAVPTDRDGIKTHSGESLVALTSSCTGQVDLEDVVVYPQELVAGPVANVLQSNSGGGTGGLQTSTLAIGLSMAAADYLALQAGRRPDLRPIADKLQADCTGLREALSELTDGQEIMTAAELRQRSNSLVLRSTQAALSAAKGAGFVATHPAGRWAREALFFLVWSCPQPVVAANLCELAQLE